MLVLTLDVSKLMVFSSNLRGGQMLLSIPIPSVASMRVFAATKFSLGHSQIWLLILCDVQAQFDRPLNFHCCSTLREGHLGIIVEKECGSGEI